ncbi:3-hydroxyacyl-CoA dehydrogenase [Desertibaculum subflavum]|uniref:3-hydroxyacyl-CoA dehydrogenase n=1 Tax=Desertibaculum subflavum TaxID=2268458 RepID=UPI000E674E09
MDLKGQVAIVTGGASGLGAGTARELTKAGAKCALFDMQEENGQKVAQEIGGLYCKVDVSKAESVQAAMAEVVSKLGGPRILVNCAGIGRAGRTVGKEGPLPLEQFAAVINVNLIGTFNCIRLFAAEAGKLAPLTDNERGVIINTASVAAFDGQIGQAAYSASKGGVVGMTLPIARDLMDVGIRVCTIAPGLFMTPMMAGLPEKAQISLGQSVPFPKRLGTPEEYARLARHICENPMLNGETIRLDGALRMAPR